MEANARSGIESEPLPPAASSQELRRNLTQRQLSMLAIGGAMVSACFWAAA